MKRVPEVVSHLVHELSPPSHEHSESLPEGQALLQAPDGGGDGVLRTPPAAQATPSRGAEASAAVAARGRETARSARSTPPARGTRWPRAGPRAARPTASRPPARAPPSPRFSSLARPVRKSINKSGVPRRHAVVCRRDNLIYALWATAVSSASRCATQNNHSLRRSADDGPSTWDTSSRSRPRT